MHLPPPAGQEPSAGRRPDDYLPRAMSIPPPFNRLRARLLLPGIVVATAVLMLLARIPPATRVFSETTIGMSVIFDAAIVLVLLLMGRRAGLDWDRLFGPTLPHTTWWLAAVALPLAALTYGTFYLLWAPLSLRAPKFVQSYALEGMPELLSAGNPGRLFLEVVAIAILAPVVEEILFRGILLHRWAARWGSTTGVVVSSALFAILHIEFIGHFVFGVTMAMLYVRTRSLWAPIAAHVLNNSLVMALMLPDALAGKPEVRPTIDQFRDEWQTGLAALLLGAAGMYWFWREFRPRGAWTLPYPVTAPQPAVEIQTAASIDVHTGDPP